MRTGPAWWLRCLALIIWRDVKTQRGLFVSIVVFQSLMGAGGALVYGFVLGDVDSTRLTFIATGAPVLALIPVGFVFLPGAIGDLKVDGSYDYTRSMPVPQTAGAVATLCVFSATALPGAAFSLAVAAWRYDIDLAISASLAPAVVLTAVMASSVGYATGHAIANPLMINLLGNITLFSVLMFSPIAFPIEQFPRWLAAVHQALPFHHMGVAIRSGLTEGLATDLTRSYLTLTGWTVAAWMLARRAIARRA